jgi:methionyl-tRNA formyltransferase
MVEKPDAGDIVDRQKVPILPDDTAFEVFRKVTVAAEIVLDRSLPALIAGSAPRVKQALAQGSYFGGRKPQDGQIDWNQAAETVHNLVRGVAPPYPGAFSTVAGKTLRVLKTLRQPGRRGSFSVPTLFLENGRCLAQCGDRSLLRLLEIELGGERIEVQDIATALGGAPISLLSNISSLT